VIRPTDDVGIFGFGFGQNFGTRHHHAHVHDFKVITLQHDGDDVFTDVMHVAFDGGDHDLAFRFIVAAAFFLLQ
jgi:hypothetical protein